MTKKKATTEDKPSESKEKVEGQVVGKVTHYFTNVQVAVVDLTSTLKIGDKIKVKGATSDFTQKVSSMQIDRKDIEEASAGQAIGIKVKEHARTGDTVYLQASKPTTKKK